MPVRYILPCGLGLWDVCFFLQLFFEIAVNKQGIALVQFPKLAACFLQLIISCSLIISVLVLQDQERLLVNACLPVVSCTQIINSACVN